MTIDLNDTYIKRWLSGLSKGTKKTYPKLLEDWLTFIGMTPTEQINKRMHDLISTEITERTFFEDKWRQYKESLENSGTNSDSKVHDRIKAVSSFFTRNSLPLALKKGDWNSTQKQEVITPKLKLNLDDIKRMYGHANLNEKCLLLILSQSGFSEVDISEQRIEGIKGLYTMPINEHYVIEKPREKTNHIQATCLSYEFLHDLRDLLAERGNPTSGFIFTSQTKEKGIANIGVRRINESMKALFEKTFGEEKAKEFQTKALRSFYNSALLRAKIQPQEVKDLMMGHDREGARANYSYDSETIREAYIMAFEHLSINGLQSREDLKNIKAEFHETIGKQQQQIGDLRKLVNQLIEHAKTQEFTVLTSPKEKEAMKEFSKKQEQTVKDSKKTV